MTERTARLSLVDVGVLAGLTILGGGSGWFLWRWFRTATADQLTIILTNTATVGGIVAGLSLAGLGALGLGGPALERLRARYGAYVRGVLLGSYGLSAVLALAAGILAAFPDRPIAAVVAAATPPVLIVVLLASTYVITSIYRLGEWRPAPPRVRGAAPQIGKPD